MHRGSQSGEEGASSHHGCIEGVDGEAIRAVAVAAGMFGGSMKYVVDLHIASLTPIRSYSIITHAELTPSPTPLASSSPIHHAIQFSIIHPSFRC